MHVHVCISWEGSRECQAYAHSLCHLLTLGGKRRETAACRPPDALARERTAAGQTHSRSAENRPTDSPGACAGQQGAQTSRQV